MGLGHNQVSISPNNSGLGWVVGMGLGYTTNLASNYNNISRPWMGGRDGPGIQNRVSLNPPQPRPRMGGWDGPGLFQLT